VAYLGAILDQPFVHVCDNIYGWRFTRNDTNVFWGDHVWSKTYI